MKLILLSFVFFFFSCDRRYDTNLTKINKDYYISFGNGRGKVLVKKDFVNNNYSMVICKEIINYRKLKNCLLIERHTTKENDKKYSSDDYYQIQKQENDSIQFWIIDFENHNKLIGPLNTNSFNNYKDSLKIKWEFININ
jgi:hypothetical protein